MKRPGYNPTADYTVLIGWRHRLLAWFAHRLGITLTYTVKFMPTHGRKRADFRGRAVQTYDTMAEAQAAFARLADPANRKEKTDGFYYLEIEGRDGIIEHQGRAQAQQEPQPESGLFQGLPESSADRPAAAPATQAAPDEAEGAAGGGTLGRRRVRDQAAAEPGRPVGYVIGPIGHTPAPDPVGPSLDDLGRR